MPNLDAYYLYIYTDYIIKDHYGAQDAPRSSGRIDKNTIDTWNERLNTKNRNEDIVKSIREEFEKTNIEATVHLNKIIAVLKKEVKTKILTDKLEELKGPLKRGVSKSVNDSITRQLNAL